MRPASALLLLAALGAAPEAKPAPDTSAALRAERRAIREGETKALTSLAAGLSGAEAEAIRSLIEPTPPEDGPTRFRPLPEVVAEVVSESLAPRDAAATRLLALAAKAAKIGRYSLADDCLRGVIARRPNHKEARRLLGYIPRAGGWATPYAAERLNVGWVDHPTFGWVPESWVPHLEKGRRPGLVKPGKPVEFPGPLTPGKPVTWMPTDHAEDPNCNIDKGWSIETAHFVIRTNVPLSEAITFGRKLEAFHDLFFALMSDVAGRDSPLAQRYDTPSPARVQSRKHRIWYFAAQAEYVNYLRPTHGDGVEVEIGHYDRPTKPGGWGTSYFFRDLEGTMGVDATLYHEASHQLLFESAGRRAFEANAGNFWVFEGLGTYFETLTPQPDGSLQIGGLVGPRVAKARANILDDGDYLPIGELVELDQATFSGDSEIYLRYAESMALVVFLMQGDGRAYREPFLDYARDATRGNLRRGRGRPLEARLGVPYATLDRRFLAFLKAGTAGSR